MLVVSLTLIKEVFLPMKIEPPDCKYHKYSTELFKYGGAVLLCISLVEMSKIAFHCDCEVPKHIGRH